MVLFPGFLGSIATFSTGWRVLQRRREYGIDRDIAWSWRQSPLESRLLGGFRRCPWGGTPLAALAVYLNLGHPATGLEDSTRTLAFRPVAFGPDHWRAVGTGGLEPASLPGFTYY